MVQTSLEQSAPPVAEQPKPAAKVWVSPEGELYKANDAGESERFKAMGYTLPTAADFKRSHIKSIYTKDYSAGEAALYGAVEGVPFLGSAIAGTANFLAPGEGDAFVAKSQLAQEQHPIVAGGAKLATGTAAFIGGEGLVGAGLKGAELLQGSSAVASVANAAVKSGAASALVGTASRTDMAIMQHISGMGGEEKLFAHLGYGALADAAIGAAVPVGLAGLGKAARGLAKGFATASESLGNTEGRPAVLAMEKIQTAYDSARAVDVHQVFTDYGFNTKTYAEVKNAVKDSMPRLESEYNNLKAGFQGRLSSTEGAALRDTLDKALAMAPEIRDDVLRRNLRQPQAGLSQLHELRMELDGRINYAAETPTPQDRALFQARQEVGTAIRTLLQEQDVAFGGAQAERWIKLDRDYSAMKVIGDVLEAKKTWVEKTFDKLDKHKTEAHLVAALGGMTGIGGHVALGGAMKVAKLAVKSEGLVRSAKFFANKVLNPAAERMTTAVESGLYGVARDAAITLGTESLRDHDFDNRYAQVQWSAANPDKAVSNITTALVGHGADMNLAGQMAMRAQMANQYLADNAPLRATSNSIIPKPPGIPPQAQREWLSLYQTIQDPAHGILNPTARNIKAMEVFYPEQLRQSREAILSQIQETPNLPMASRMYAARVLNQPVDNLTSGFFNSVLAQGEAEQEAQAKQAQSSVPRQSNVASESNPDTSRMQRLQGA